MCERNPGLQGNVRSDAEMNHLFAHQAGGQPGAEDLAPYIAHQLSEMNRKLDRVVRALEALARSGV